MVDDIKLSKDGSKKYLFKLHDSLFTEAVYLPQADETMFCISSQVGCPNKCRHCATSRISFKRDLSWKEIVGQYATISSYEKNESIVKLLFMGMGEPLLNYDNVVNAINNFKYYFGIKGENITLSTSGITTRFNEISKIINRPRLAVSIHAADGNKRDVLMPINKIFNLENLINNVTEYINTTNDNVIIEYTLLADFNDTEKDKIDLLLLLNHIKDKVEIQLIPLNESKFVPYRRSKNISKFESFFRENGFTVFVKQSMGSDVDAGCGQLVAGIDVD
ncbi:MAG: radical SAM protein [Nanoarchaeota archaeon]